MFSIRFSVSASLLALTLSGCASLPADWGRPEVAKLTADRGRALPQPSDIATFNRELLAKPLTATAAVQLALVNNPAVRAETARLGFAAADVYEAGRLANPVFSFALLTPGPPDAVARQVTLGVAVSFIDLLFLPARQRYADTQFEAAKLSVGSVAINLAADTERAWYEAVGAQQLAVMRETVSKAARASADLAQRFVDAGTLSKRELALEQAAASQAYLDLIGAQAKAVEMRTALSRLMGLPAVDDRWVLDARLAEPLVDEDSTDELLKLAVDGRLDVAAADKRAAAFASRYRLERHSRLVDNIQIGYQRQKDYDGSVNDGPTLSLGIPIFNWGSGRVAAAQAQLQQAEAELDSLVLDRANDIKLAQAQVLAAKARATGYRTQLIPQREEVVARMQQEVNFMFIGIFELLVAKQQEYDAYAGYLESVRDYWIARVELARAVGRNLPSSAQAAQPVLDPVQLIVPKSGGMDHSQHSMGGMSKDVPGMDGMKGMDHSQMGKPATPAAATASGNPHTGHNKGGMTDKESAADKMSGMDMKDTPGMKGMGHSQMGKPATPESAPASGNPHAGHDMGGMEMKTETPPDCAAMKKMTLSKLDPTVVKAMREQCKGSGKAGSAAPASPDPLAGHDMKDMPMKGMDHGTPSNSEPATTPETPHEH